MGLQGVAEAARSTDPTAVPLPPAYPLPIRLPPAPGGEAEAARRLAAAYDALAGALTTAAHRAVATLDGLDAAWRGEGSTARAVPADVIGADAMRLARGLRQAAEQLRTYAAHAEHARHHHGWSLGRLLAVGAVVAVTATVVVVTVGAAAPVGSAAAVEVGEALAGAEAAAATASAAESALAESLAGLRTVLTAVRALSLSHVEAGAANGGLDAVGQLVRHGHVDMGEVAETALAGTIASGVTAAAVDGVTSTAAYEGAGDLGRLGLEATALAGSNAAVDAGRQLADTGSVDGMKVAESGAMGALAPGARSLRKGLHRVDLRPQWSSAPAPQTVYELLTQPIDLEANESRVDGDGLGHTIAKHVGKTVAWLRSRLLHDPDSPPVAATFFDKATAERAIEQVVRANASEILAWHASRSGGKTRAFLYETGAVQGIAIPRGHNEPMPATRVQVVLTRHKGDGISILSSFPCPPTAQEGKCK